MPPYLLKYGQIIYEERQDSLDTVKYCNYSDKVCVLFLERHHLHDVSCLDASLLVSLKAGLYG